MSKAKFTSRISYDQAKRDGTLSTLDQQVCEALKLRVTGGVGPVFRTRREVAQYLNDQASTISGTVNRLILLGAVSVDGFAKCSVTGRKVERISLVRGHVFGDGSVATAQPSGNA